MAKTIDDRVLVDKFKGGDDSVFEAVVARYSSEVAVFVNRLLGWPSDVEDIVQETFLSAYLGLKRFRGQCSLKTWLFTIAINKCRSHRARRILRLRKKSSIEQIAPKGDKGSDEPLIRHEDTKRVLEAVRQLPAKYREVIVLRYLQELGTAQICGVLGVSGNSVQVRLSRARELLRDKMPDLLEEK